MSIFTQLFSSDFSWLWLEIGRNAGLCILLSLPLVIASKKVWPAIVALFIGVFVIDLHGYPKVLSRLGFEIQSLNGRTIVNTYGFELLLIVGIYAYYLINTLRRKKIARWWEVQAKYSLLILAISIGFNANILIDTFIMNDELFYEPMTTILKLFMEVNAGEIHNTFLFAYATLFFAGICTFSAIYQRQEKHLLFFPKHRT